MISRDDPPDSPPDDPEEALRQLLRESAASDEMVPRAKHKRYAKREMRRRKESAHMLDIQSGRRDDTPLTPIRTHLTSKVKAIDPAQPGVFGADQKNREGEVERLRAERRRLQELVHKLRKEATDSKRELRFTKEELKAMEGRDQVLLRENQRLQRALLRVDPPSDRERRVSGVSHRKGDELADDDEDDRTGTR